MTNELDIAASTGRKYILVGEDDTDDQEILAEIFEKIDPELQLKFINNGKKLAEFTARIEAGKLPCMILLDYNMPELNGGEILRLLKTNTALQHIIKIVWSTSSAPAYKQNCIREGAREYLVKPSTMNELTIRVKHLLEYCT